jgi:uncharacterized membrane protein (DUF2068 family)
MGTCVSRPSETQPASSIRSLGELSVRTFLYAGLFTTEGIGLLLRKCWAEYFTIVTTGGLIPLEVYELWRHFRCGIIARYRFCP